MGHLIYTEKTLPLILEALDINYDNIELKDIVGINKDLTLETNLLYFVVTN